jgi:pimeloyl-ACP methyl ester carboxylesterase
MRPTLLLAGEGDVYCPRPRLEALARTMPKPEVVIVPGTDHFLWRREKAVAETVGAFAVRTLLSADGRQG